MARVRFQKQARLEQRLRTLAGLQSVRRTRTGKLLLSKGQAAFVRKQLAIMRGTSKARQKSPQGLNALKAEKHSLRHRARK